MNMLSRPANRRLSPRELARRQAEKAVMGPEAWQLRQIERRRNEQPLAAKLSRAIAEVATKVRDIAIGPTKTLTLSQEADFSEGRRQFLRKAATASAFAIPGVGLLSKLAHDAEGMEEVRSRVSEILAEPGDVEALPNGALIPEDERSGSNIMIGVNPEYSMIPLYGYDFEAALDESPGPVLAALEAGTTVHVTVPTETKEEFLELAKERYPKLDFVIYELPLNPTVGYTQDMVFATGSRRDNRFVMASSSLDTTEYRDLPHYTVPTVPTINVDRLANIVVDRNEVIAAVHGMNLLGDEMLFRDNPDTFKNYRMPVKLEGGDLDAVRLPNGEVGVLVGPRSVVSGIVNLANKEAGEKKYTINELDGFSEMPREEFLRFFRRLRRNYAKYFGVSEVIFLDEENMLQLAETHEEVPLENLMPKKFFHTDMVVKVATDGDGKPVAFCTACNDPSERLYLKRVREKLAALGYGIVDLPCGPFPTMSYTNGLMYTRNRQKTVILPQYGIPEDEVAAKVYEERGFRVVKADLSDLKNLDPEKLDNLGSVHCRAEVLA